MQRWFGNLIFLVVALLAGTSAYYGAKTVSLERRLAVRTSPTPSASSPTNPTSSPSTAASPISPLPTAAANEAADAPKTLAAAERVSQPADTYTVAAGDTLYPIGLKHDIAWERIADANGLTEPYVLQIGSNLIIPKLTATKETQIAFTADLSRARIAQARVSQGSDAWRTDPLSIAKLEHTGAFGLNQDADFRLMNQTETAAAVVATRLSGSLAKTYRIALSQPADQGVSGIWAIQSITTQD